MRLLRTTLVLVLAFAPSLFAQTTNPVVAYAYAGTGSNRIFAYAVRANGTTTALPGSPFTGPGIRVVNTTNFLFATDFTNIITYQRSSTGAIHPVATINGVAHNDTPADSEVGFLTLDRTGASLYAGEINFQSTGNNAFAEFAKQSNGSLQFRANTPINVNDGGPLVFSTNNAFAYGTGCTMATWTIFGFFRAPNGTLTSFDPGTTIPPTTTVDLCPGAAASSSRGYLAVAYSTVAAVPVWSIAIYQISSSGSLRRVSTHSTTFPSISSMRFDQTGNFLAVGGKGIAIYRLNSNATITKLSGRIDTSVNFNSVVWDHNSHVLATSSSAFYGFNVRLGVISQVGSSHPIGSSGTNVAVIPLH